MASRTRGLHEHCSDAGDRVSGGRDAAKSGLIKYHELLATFCGNNKL
jgi:hypothetical protein